MQVSRGAECIERAFQVFDLDTREIGLMTSLPISPQARYAAMGSAPPDGIRSKGSLRGDRVFPKRSKNLLTLAAIGYLARFFVFFCPSLASFFNG